MMRILKDQSKKTKGKRKYLKAQVKAKQFECVKMDRNPLVSHTVLEEG